MKSGVGEGRAVKKGYAGGYTETIFNIECAQGKLIEREQIRMKNRRIRIIYNKNLKCRVVNLK